MGKMMKVVLITRSTLYSIPGGDTVQVVQTARQLTELHVDTEIVLSIMICFIFLILQGLQIFFITAKNQKSLLLFQPYYAITASMISIIVKD
jgi:hypothetical protein